MYRRTVVVPHTAVTRLFIRTELHYRNRPTVFGLNHQLASDLLLLLEKGEATDTGTVLRKNKSKPERSTEEMFVRGWSFPVVSTSSACLRIVSQRDVDFSHP